MVDYNKICSQIIDEWYKIAPFSHITAEKTYRAFDDGIEIHISWVVRGKTCNISRVVVLYELVGYKQPIDMIREVIGHAAREYYNTLIVVEGEGND